MSLRPAKKCLQLETNTQGSVRVATIQVHGYQLNKTQLVDDTLKNKMMLLSATPTQAGPPPPRGAISKKRSHMKEGMIKRLLSNRDNKEVVLALIADPTTDDGEGGQILQHVSKRLRDDKEVVENAVKQNAYAFKHASERLRADKDFVILLIGRSPGLSTIILHYASIKLRNDKQVVLAAMKNQGERGEALYWASDELKDDVDVVRASVTTAGDSYRFASEGLLNSPLRSLWT